MFTLVCHHAFQYSSCIMHSTWINTLKGNKMDLCSSIMLKLQNMWWFQKTWTSKNVIHKETGISSLRVFIVGRNLRIFKVKTLQMSQQLSDSTLCGSWINVWMAATSFQFFHKWRNPSDELCSAFKDKITTTKQYSSLVSTTQEDKDL